MAHTRTIPVPEVGARVPEFDLPSAQGGQLRLGMRTPVGPVIVVFYSGVWSEEDVAYFKDLAKKEGEINLAGASVVSIGTGEVESARHFLRETGIKSYVLYDYSSATTRDYGLLQKDSEHGEYARPATFIINFDHEVVHAWVGERPNAEEVLARVSEITGLPKPAEEKEEEGGNRKKPSPEERERRRAGRRANREANQVVSTDGE